MVFDGLVTIFPTLSNKHLCQKLRQQRAAELIAALTLPRSSWARALALTGLALLLLVQTLSLVSRPTVKEAPPEFEPMAAEEQPQQLYRSYATKGLEPQTSPRQVCYSHA